MLRCKKEETAGEEPASAAAAVDFLSKFSGKRFDALVAEAEPHAASATLQQAFAQRLEDLADETEIAGEEVEVEDEEEEKKDEEEEELVPPWRRRGGGAGCPPAVKSIPVSPAGTGSMSDPRGNAPSSQSCLPASAPSGFCYGPGTGLQALDRDGKTQRFFDNGDPFKKPDGYKGSQRQWERQHGHERQRGGENLGTLIYVFTVRDHLALFRKQWSHDSLSIDHQITFAQHSVAI